MLDINTREYWEKRFRSGSWGRNGRRQTLEYAKANVNQVGIFEDFNGTILDFGCALGDAIPVYKTKYPKARVCGFDISQKAIDYCRKKYGTAENFYMGSIDEIPDTDIIIASHVMEHITKDKELIRVLLGKCNELYVVVPYMESPLYHEHVNWYNEDYYNDLRPMGQRTFEVSYKINNSVKEVVKRALRLRFSFFSTFTKRVIMFHFQSGLDQKQILR